MLFIMLKVYLEPQSLLCQLENFIFELIPNQLKVIENLGLKSVINFRKCNLLLEVSVSLLNSKGECPLFLCKAHVKVSPR